MRKLKRKRIRQNNKKIENDLVPGGPSQDSSYLARKTVKRKHETNHRSNISYSVIALRACGHEESDQSHGGIISKTENKKCVRY